METRKRKERPPKQKAPNPIASAIQEWLATLPSEFLERLGQPTGHPSSPSAAAADLLVSTAPKRWVLYEPMVLLPSGSFSSELWKTLLGALDADQAAGLWTRVLAAISKSAKEPMTHLAVNEGIPLHVGGGGPTRGQEIPPGAAASTTAPEEHAPGGGDGGSENVLRSPSGLRILHGDFGPDHDDDGGGAGDFDAAFWVSTRQNGIFQTWAPRWTMFSRGNVKEKARLLDFHAAPAPPARGGGEAAKAEGRGEASFAHKVRSKADLAGGWAVDLYAGIGYFAFSYARLGLRVLCWELNPWSVEGLRRAAVANRWSIRVVRGDDLAGLSTVEVVRGGEQIVVFLEDNREASRRIAELRAAAGPPGLDVLHVNCGFLPSSSDTWRPAWDIQRRSSQAGWLHLHENVGVADLDTRRREIQEMLDRWAQEARESRHARVEHVELVKTFAPNVWHCVFDVYIAAREAAAGDSGGTT